MMDPNSPFARFEKTEVKTQTRTIHVNFCTICHYVWKAPTAAKTCINCIGNGECATSLVSYETEVPIT